MKDRLCSENPFGPTPQGLVWQGLRTLNSRTHMDFGTHDGAVLRGFLESGLIERGIGLDANADVVQRSRQHMPAGMDLEVIEPNAQIGHPDASFDSISAIGVIEHIHDQQATLRQFHRLLRQEGFLIVAVPGKHFFSFLDVGNYKFLFPTFHRWAYSLWKSPEEYRRRYVECANGLFGDIEVAKMWHEHFSVADLNSLMEQSGFRLIRHDGLGFFRRVIAGGTFLMPGPVRRLAKRIMDLDARMFSQAELVIVAQKVG